MQHQDFSFPLSPQNLNSIIFFGIVEIQLVGANSCFHFTWRISAIQKPFKFVIKLTEKLRKCFYLIHKYYIYFNISSTLDLVFYIVKVNSKIISTVNCSPNPNRHGTFYARNATRCALMDNNFKLTIKDNE